MSLTVVCGANWGDEGKGRIVDYLAREADFVVRYQGGNNAGHTVENERGRFALHLVPSGIFYPAVTNVLGPGMVIDLEGMCKEIAQLEQAGISCAGLKISSRATIVLPFHRDQDAWEEERLGSRAYGSTKNGIAPAYGDRHMKKALQVGALLDPAPLADEVRELIAWKNLIADGVYGKGRPYSADDTLAWLTRFGEPLRARICDTTALLGNAARAGKRILLEAQLGALRDLYFGIDRYTPPPCSRPSGAPAGAGLFGHPVERVIAVVKAFSTCVGEGPFVTRMDEEEARALRETAFEYGATTGRPRSIGHFDAVATRYGVEVQGATEIALTKLDSLSGRTRLAICTHYELEGRTLERFPLTPVLERARPRYLELDGWQDDIQGCRRFEELPEAARRYVRTIEDLVGCRIRYVSVGPRREQMIEKS
jgi:adenylosuccinate synthase